MEWIEYLDNFWDDTRLKDSLEEKLITNGISFVKDFMIDETHFDFKIDNTLIEIDCLPRHCTEVPEGISKLDHKNKSIIGENAGYRVMHVFDWDNLDKIIVQLLPKRRLYARKCEVRRVPINEEKKFCHRYHLQNYVRSEVCLGLYYGGRLVSLMSFGKPRYNKNYQWEILRYCSNSMVIGGYSKLWEYFLKECNPDSIISYCDRSKFPGRMYLSMGLEEKANSIALHWWVPSLQKHFTDNILRQHGFDRLLGKEFGTYGKGTDNKVLLVEVAGGFSTYDCGQAVYVKNFR